MDKQVKFLRRIWRAGATTLVVIGIVGSSFVFGLSGVWANGDQSAESSPSPSPTPSATPTPSPSPTPQPSPNVGGNINVNTNTANSTSTSTNTNENKIENKNENKIDIKIENKPTETQTVTLAQAQTVAATGSAITKQPETGVGLLSLAGIFGAGPVGFALSKYGAGAAAISIKREEELMSFANALFTERKIKTKA